MKCIPSSLEGPARPSSGCRNDTTQGVARLVWVKEAAEGRMFWTVLCGKGDIAACRHLHAAENWAGAGLGRVGAQEGITKEGYRWGRLNNSCGYDSRAGLASE
jgi:hypothetical protein